MAMTHPMFKNKTLNKNKLIPFGFIESNGIFTYRTQILDGQFEMIVKITSTEEVSTKLIDTCTQEPYTLHLVESASGTFVGSVRCAYEEVLNEISEKCFETDVFKSSQAHKIINYISDKYGDKLEFLWEKFSQNAIWRRKDNNKWYGILLIVPKNKLGLNSDENIDIIDLRADPEIIAAIVDKKKYFPGYHMNKKHWITICLDDTLPTEEIYGFIDKSYELAKGK